MSPFKNICVDRPESYSEYEEMKINWNPVTDYEVYQKLGRGRYSEVFAGICKPNNTEVVIKILKPVKIEKQYREIKIL